MSVSRFASLLGSLALLIGCDSAPSEPTTGGTGGSTAVSATGGATSTTSTPPASTSTLHVNGNKLEDNGKTIRLIGWDRPGTEYMCITGGAIFDGPTGTSNVQLMQTWTGFNAIRLPLNETCWLGINGVAATLSGTRYINALTDYVKLLRSSDIYVILDLHWNGPGTFKGTTQLPMADKDHSIDFWTAVANQFKGDLGVIFDLYNEPHLDAVDSLTGGDGTAWGCWLNGGCQVTPRAGNEQQVGAYTIAGMQEMLTAVRSTGAQNVVLVGGNNWAGDMSQWAANAPTDSTGNLVASVHAYNFANCRDVACETILETIASSTPIVIGEFGEDDCDSQFIGPFMDWADTNGLSYLAWSWGSEDCSKGPSITTNNTLGVASGTAPNGYGVYFKNHIANLPAQ